MSKILQYSIAVAAIALCLVVLFVYVIPSPFSASLVGIPRLAIVSIVGLGAFIFVGLVYVYSFKSKR